MTDEIRPTSIYRSRRVKPLSREDREENEERFEKKLAELSGLSDKEHDDADSDAGHDEERGHEEVPASAPSHVGRHLDIET